MTLQSFVRSKVQQTADSNIGQNRGKVVTVERHSHNCLPPEDSLVKLAVDLASLEANKWFDNQFQKIMAVHSKI